MIKVGDRVFITGQAILCKVVAIQMQYRAKELREIESYAVRYYSPSTGKLMTCPDKRCGSAGCVICGRHVWIDQITPVPPVTEALLRVDGIITD